MLGNSTDRQPGSPVSFEKNLSKEVSRPDRPHGVGVAGVQIEAGDSIRVPSSLCHSKFHRPSSRPNENGQLSDVIGQLNVLRGTIVVSGICAEVTRIRVKGMAPPIPLGGVKQLGGWLCRGRRTSVIPVGCNTLALWAGRMCLPL